MAATDAGRSAAAPASGVGWQPREAADHGFPVARMSNARPILSPPWRQAVARVIAGTAAAAVEF